MTSRNMKDFLKKDVLNFLTLGINAKEEYTKLFSLSLSITKTALIIILIVVTFIYQTKYKDVKWSFTKLNNDKHLVKELSSASVLATCSMFPILVYLYTRFVKSDEIQTYSQKIIHSIPGMLIAWVIVFLLDISRESSGLNRYLSEAEIKLKEGEYYEISEGDIKFFDSNNLDIQGEPFIYSFAWTAIFFTTIIITYLILMMIISTIYGITSGDNGIAANIGWPKFSMEILAMFIFSFLGVMLSGYIKKGKLEGNYLSSAIMGTISVCLHIIFQFVGLYGSVKPTN